MGAHAIPTQSATAPGINLTLAKVANGVAGKAPTVTFTIQRQLRHGITMAQMTGGSQPPGPGHGRSDHRLRLHQLRLRRHHPGLRLREPGSHGQAAATDGTCTYTFTHAIPAKATGTYAIGIEGRRGLTMLPGTHAADDHRVRRHQQGDLLLGGWLAGGAAPHGGRHRQLQQLPHAISRCTAKTATRSRCACSATTPARTTPPTRPSATVAADKALPPQAHQLRLMVHKIHTGDNHGATSDQTYIIVGFGGSHNDFAAHSLRPIPITNTGVPTRRWPTVRRRHRQVLHVPRQQLPKRSSRSARTRWRIRRAC